MILLHIKIKTLVKVRNGFKSVLCDNLEGWDGVGGEKEVQQGGDICMYTCGRVILIHGRNQHNIVKQLFSN